MSWYIQQLIRNKLHIKASNDINSDDFNNLLDVEMTISKMIDSGILDEFSSRIVLLAADGYTFGEIATLLGVNRMLISEKFSEVCSRVGFVLGGIFTDEGYLEYFKNKYKLENDQLEKAFTYMKSQFKSKLIRGK